MIEDVFVIHSLLVLTRDSQDISLHLLVLPSLSSRVLGTILSWTWRWTSVAISSVSGARDSVICPALRMGEMAGDIGNTRLHSGDRSFPRDHPSAQNGQEAKEAPHVRPGAGFGDVGLTDESERHVVLLFCLGF